MSRFLKRKIGIAFWAITVIAVALGFKQSHQQESSGQGVSLTEYFRGPADHVELTDLSGRAEENDPVFWEDDRGNWKQVGYVIEVPRLADGEGDVSDGDLKLAWYSRDVSAAECEFFQYRSTGSLEEMIATMLPPEKQVRIQQRLAAVMSEHGDELSKSFVPLVQQSLKRSMPVIEDEFRRVVEAHREDIDKLAQRWNDEIVNDRLIPLAKKEIMPIVRKHGQPPAEEIGREIWDRASLWRFGWRAVYDKTPLPERNLVQEEWKRFVQTEVRL